MKYKILRGLRFESPLIRFVILKPPVEIKGYPRLSPHTEVVGSYRRDPSELRRLIC